VLVGVHVVGGVGVEEGRTVDEREEVRVALGWVVFVSVPVEK
jgi:hypothetical protein